MITAPLQEQVKFQERLANPNYVIIVQNKAPNIDFSQFKAIGLDGENYRKRKISRYVMTCDSLEDRPGFSKVRVLDGYHEVIGVTCKNEKIDKWLERFKYEYNALLTTTVIKLIPTEEEDDVITN